MNIIQAFSDPKVLGFAFAAETWRPWRVLLAGAFGLPLDGNDAETFRRLTSREALRQAVRELWVIAGRRSGKTSVAAGIAIYSATLMRWKLSPGEVGTSMLLAKI